MDKGKSGKVDKGREGVESWQECVEILYGLPLCIFKQLQVNGMPHWHCPQLSPSTFVS